MQSVIFTPPRVNWYVKEALAALNYKRNCDIFGMFFIPLVDIDLPWLIEDLPEIDTIEVVRELKLTVTRRRKPQPERQEHEDETRYPLGETPTWKQIAGSLQSDPTLLIPRWEEPDIERFSDCDQGSAESLAVEIFIRFTCHMWILLNPSWRIRPENRINPTTLSGALRCWSVDVILEEIMDASFKACHSERQSGPGRPSMSFSERRKLYFPDDEPKEMAKVWRHLGEAPGYIHKYFQLRKRLGPEAKSLLDECLEELLSLCQCLPDSSRSKSAGWIWKVERKKIVVLTNPKFYRLKRIGQKPSTRVKSRNGQAGRAAPAHRNARSTAVAMMVSEDIPEEVAEKAYRATRRPKKNQDKRSAKLRNRRKPPQKKSELIEDEAEDDNDDYDDNEEGDELQHHYGNGESDDGDDEDSESLDEEEWV
jgi:hypothetical protein